MRFLPHRIGENRIDAPEVFYEGRKNHAIVLPAHGPLSIRQPREHPRKAPNPREYGQSEPNREWRRRENDDQTRNAERDERLKRKPESQQHRPLHGAACLSRSRT